MSDSCLQTVDDEIYNGRLAQRVDRNLEGAADADDDWMPDAVAAVVR